MKNIKNILTACIILGLAVPVLQGCKKGEEDPFISFKSRNSRVTGTWTLKSSEMSGTTNSTEKVTNDVNDDERDETIITTWSNTYNGNSKVISRTYKKDWTDQDEWYNWTTTNWSSQEVVYSMDSSYNSTVTWGFTIALFTDNTYETTETTGNTSGDWDYDWLDKKSEKYPNRERYKLFNFLTKELKNAYAISDIIISRAGNNVLTEIAAMSKPSIIIPLESSANDHQLANAKVYSREGAIYVMLQSHLTSEKLFKQVDSLLNDDEELKFLSEKIHEFYKEDAAAIIAKNLTDFYKQCIREKEKKDAGKKHRRKKSEQKKKNQE